MPLCFCYTDLVDSEIPEGFEKRLSELIAEVLSKPEERVSVMISSGIRMCKGGTAEKGLVLQIRSIAVFDEHRNPDYFPKFFDFLTKELPLTADRITIEFIDIQGHNAMTGKPKK